VTRAASSSCRRHDEDVTPGVTTRRCRRHQTTRRLHRADAYTNSTARILAGPATRGPLSPVPS
jgi:hypothetical protein